MCDKYMTWRLQPKALTFQAPQTEIRTYVQLKMGKKCKLIFLFPHNI